MMKTYPPRFVLPFRNFCSGIGTILLALTACSKTAQYVGEEVKCMICLAEIDAGGVDADSRWWTEKECQKPFHKECIQEWMETQRGDSIKPSCPHCRAFLPGGVDGNVSNEDNQPPLEPLDGVDGNVSNEVNQPPLEPLDGVDGNVSNEVNQPPLHRAIYRRSLETIRELLAAGADLEERDPNGQTPLHLAIKIKSLKMVRALLEGGADVNERDPDGQTPLHLAIKIESLEMVRALLKGGADVEARLNTRLKNQPPLHLAIETGSEEIFQELLDWGADINARTFYRCP